MLMKHSIPWMLCVLFILGGVSCQTLSTADQTGGKDDEKAALRPETLVHDAGTVWNGRFIRHTFVLENRDSEPWEIRDVIEGEGVRVSRFSRSVPPGGLGEVEFEVSTRRLSGKFRKTARVDFKSPRRPPIELAVTGEVKTSVVAGPQNVVRFRNEKGKPLSWRFAVTSPQKRDFTIRRIETFTPYLSTEFRRAKAAEAAGTGNAYDLTVTLAAEAPMGIFRDLVKIHTDIPDGYPGEILISGAIEGPIAYSPPHLKFSTLQDGSYPPARLNLFNRRGASFRVIGIETDSIEIQWKAMPYQNGRTQVIEIRWTAKPSDRLLNGKLVFLTDIAGEERIEVPYVVIPFLDCQGKPCKE